MNAILPNERGKGQHDEALTMSVWETITCEFTAHYECWNAELNLKSTQRSIVFSAFDINQW